MARIDNLSDADRYRIEQARRVLAERPDFSDAQAVAHRLGRVEIALQQLVDVFDEGSA
jgi:hypothetical protein